MVILGVTLALAAILIDLVALLCWQKPHATVADHGNVPSVSVLVAIRDEAHNVKGLIKSLQQLDYPKHKLEFLIGEDRSKDHTLSLLEQETRHDHRFRIIRIQNDLPGLFAKGNVISQLIDQCTTPYYFITDADVRVSQSWISGLLSMLGPQDGAVGGTTVVNTVNLWTGLQNIDWLLAQGLLLIASKFLGCQAISGTNMMITQQACNAIGGYQTIPYSLTEDIGFLTAIKRVGFTATNALNKQSLATIEGLPDWRSLVAQRARWAYGVFRIHPLLVSLLVVRSLFLISLLMIAGWQPIWAIVLLFVKFMIDWSFVAKVATTLDQKVKLGHFVCFEFYWASIAISGLFIHLFSTNKSWKGRTYK